MELKSVNRVPRILRSSLNRTPKKRISINNLSKKILSTFHYKHAITCNFKIKWHELEDMIKRERSLTQKAMMIKKAIEYLKHKIKTKTHLDHSGCNTDILYIYWFSIPELEKMEEIRNGLKFIENQVQKYAQSNF